MQSIRKYYARNARLFEYLKQKKSENNNKNKKHMKITIEKLKNLEACKDGIRYFEKNHGQEASIDDVLTKLREDKTTTDYMFWLFRNFKLDGLSERFFESGKIEWRENYKNGKLDGLREWFFENGTIKMRANFKNGKCEGLFEMFFENGQIEVRENFKAGKRDGVAEWFYRNGDIKWRANYKDGELIV